MRGRFSLKISKDLPVAKKIEKYGQDNMIFHLHKRRNFLRKIERQVQDEADKINEKEKLKHLIESNQAMIDEAKAFRRVDATMSTATLNSPR